MSAYVRSFEADERDVLRAGTTFDEVLGLYIFDRKLRLIVLDALERVEVAVRAALGDQMALCAWTALVREQRPLRPPKHPYAAAR